MTRRKKLKPLTFEEAEIVAEDLARAWESITGSHVTPPIETLADIVQRVQRRAAEIIDGRDH